MQTVQGNKKLILLILIVVSSIVLIIQQQLGEDATREELTKSRFNNVNPDILPSIHAVSDTVHRLATSRGGVDDGEFSYNDKTITLINGYPSAEDIGVVADLAEGSYDVDKASAESALIINGDCLIIYTEARTGMPPKIIDLFNTCK